MSMFEKIRKMPLKNLDSAGLAIALQESVRAYPEHFDFDKVYKAIAAATYLHVKQTRANRGNLPRTPYIEHPLRNAIRLVRWGCLSQDIIIATILHDTVEDGAVRICRDEYGLDVKTLTESEMRARAFQYIESEFGEEVCRLVAGVTNGLFAGNETKEEKRIIYANHVRKVIADPDIFLVKFSDFVDNAAGLYHNDIKANEEKVIHLAAKYLPVVDIFEAQFEKSIHDLKISNAARVDFRKHLRDTRTRLVAIMARA